MRLRPTNLAMQLYWFLWVMSHIVALYKIIAACMYRYIVHILQFGKLKIANVDCMLTLNVAHQTSPRTEQPASLTEQPCRERLRDQ